MKKQLIYGLSLIFLAVGLNSCGKTTKRKITNDWKIVSLEDEAENNSPNTFDSHSYSKTTMTESTVSNYSTYTYMAPETVETLIEQSNGSVKANNLTIKKDGTWQWDQELFYEKKPQNSNAQNITVKKNLSGTWSFVGTTKGNDFKKNERILFNILQSKDAEIFEWNSGGGNEVLEEHTYLTSEKTMTFTVKESSKKELRLEMESASNNTYPWSSGVETRSKTLKMTLKEPE
ncbi:MAG: hypothetical protein ACO1N0_16355 [Fluviicola sp.]